jgi:hypothetical protein
MAPRGRVSRTGAGHLAAKRDARRSLGASLADGTEPSKSVSWSATVSSLAEGPAVASVDFVVDGMTIWSERRSPYEFNDDGNLFDRGCSGPDGTS